MIEVKNLCVTYPGGTVAVSDISFRVGEGESVAVVGANGAGKSTLFLALVGILEPSAGSVSIGGIELTKKNLPAIRAQAGLIFQNPDDQLFMQSIYDDIAFGPRNYGFCERQVEERVSEVLKKLKIEHLKDRMPHQLSAGEKRLAALGGVLAMRPSVMLLDEPSSFLDPRARRCMIELLLKLPITRLVATHDLDMALRLCNRAIVLKSGRLFADGDAKKVLTDAQLMDEAGLEPYEGCFGAV